jgi:hypothetical protein
MDWEPEKFAAESTSQRRCRFPRRERGFQRDLNRCPCDGNLETEIQGGPGDQGERPLWGKRLQGPGG